MHRRQFLPGSRDGLKLNRSKLYEQSKDLKKRLAEQDALIAERNEQLQAWDVEAISRGVRRLLAELKRVLVTPIRFDRNLGLR